jgi:hypothetical protein
MQAIFKKKIFKIIIFYKLLIINLFNNNKIYTFVTLSEEETGSAGEQPVSNMIANGKMFSIIKPPMAAFFMSFFSHSNKKNIF